MLDQIKGIRREPEVLSHTVREACSMEAGLDEADAINALRTIEEVWDHLFPAEQARIAHALIERITVRPDGGNGLWQNVASVRIGKRRLPTGAVSDLCAHPPTV